MKVFTYLVCLLCLTATLQAQKNNFSTTINGLQQLLNLQPDQATKVSIQTSEGLVKLWLKRKQRNVPTGYLISSVLNIPTQAPDLKLYRGRVLAKRNRQNRLLAASANLYKNTLTIKFAGNRKKMYAINTTFSKNGDNTRATYYPGSLALPCAANERHGDIELPALSSLPARVRSSRTLELGMHADYEYYQANGSNSSDTIAALETIVNDVDAIYANQLNISVVLSGYKIRTSSSQPYTSFDIETLLQQFSNYLSDNPTQMQGDLDHLMTGKNTSYEGNSSVAGLAWLGVICSEYSPNTGVSERFSSAVQHLIVAHELGHNFGANHDTSATTSIMYPSVSSTQTTFSNSSKNSINSFLSGNDSCLLDTSVEPTSDLRLKVKLTSGNTFKFILTPASDSLVGCTINVYGASTSAKLSSSPTLILTATGTVTAGQKEKFKFSNANRTPKATTYFKAVATCASELTSNEKTLAAGAGSNIKQIKVARFLSYLIDKFN